MNLSLSDIVPPLRWTPASQVASVATDPRLPDAWWQALPLARAIDLIGIPQISIYLAEITRGSWGHVLVGDILPALHFIPQGTGIDFEALAGDRHRLLTGTAEGLPPEVLRTLFAETLNRLAASIAGEPEPSAEPEPTPPVKRVATPTTLPEILDSAFYDIDERQRVIARSRTYGDERLTLDELAQRFDVTRERVRQLERDLREHVDTWLQGNTAAPVVTHLNRLREALGVAFPLDVLVAAAPWHTAELPSIGVPAWRVVQSVLGYEPSDGWLVLGGAETLREKTRQLITDGPRPIPEALELIAQIGIRPDVAERWLGSVPQIKILGDHVAPWPRSVSEKADAVLSLAGHPLSPEEIQERIGEDYSLVGIRNQLTADNRFIRLDRNKYGLSRWGGEEYLGIREMIVREIERAGGEAEVNAIVARLTERFDVSESSVRAYAGGPGFERTQRGWIRVAAGGPAQPYQPRRDVAATRRCFRGPDGRWWHRVDLNAEHLRGSGSPLPTGFAAYLGMAPGGQLTASAAAGDVLISWHNQPTMGSIRPILQEYNAAEGDHIFLTVSDGGELLLRHLPASAAGPHLPPAVRALHLSGYTAPVGSDAEAIRLISSRIGLDEPLDLDAVLLRLRERGDRDIHALLGGAPDA
ncbi:sigma factor-like helix-turn-helix DNA-binding protein [Rhizohabitans arisaemae]|uniref:sigma factor-like helix-turn-helix DNA-binding protein n=1 Tax=Rhizohabitans arisaemae TaxID=2720610 RepID=UPI0024B04F25|nr:sigma factor-like helix-turn-helix DNA-binding protein [Rhizohabitans arisaemae]